jgi:hypothetical protein
MLHIAIIALEALAGAFHREPRTPQEVERRRVQRRNERAMMLFCTFCVVLCIVLLLIMALN